MTLRTRVSNWSLVVTLRQPSAIQEVWKPQEERISKAGSKVVCSIGRRTSRTRRSSGEGGKRRCGGDSRTGRGGGLGG